MKKECCKRRSEEAGRQQQKQIRREGKRAKVNKRK